MELGGEMKVEPCEGKLELLTLVLLVILVMQHPRILCPISSAMSVPWLR